MNHQEFSRLLEQKKLPSVLFFEGAEEYLKETALRNLRSALLPAGLEDLNESRLDAPDASAVIAAAETLPFMAERRLVLLRDHPAVVGRGEADESLLAYLPHVPPTAVVLFYCVLPVKQKKIRNLVQKQGGLVTFEPLSDRELTSFVTSAFHDLGRECDARTADFLVFTSGRDLNLLLREIGKIAAYHPEEPSVRPEEIRALATPSAESRVFDMVNAIVAGDGKRAFTLLRNLLQNGERRIMILSLLLRQFRLMQQIRIMQYEKLRPQEIQSALGMNSWAAQQLARQAGAFTGRQIRDAVALCLEADLNTKSGVLREEGALEALMFRLLLLKEPGNQNPG